jgi:hypothetical protein
VHGLHCIELQALLREVEPFDVPMTRRTRFSVVLLSLAAMSPLAAQSPAAGAPRPATIARSGAVPREPAAEQKLQSTFKAPEGFRITLFAGPPVAMYPTCVNESPDGAVFVCVDPNLSLSTLRGVGRIMRLVDSTDAASAPNLTQAVRLMHLEATYSQQLAGQAQGKGR